MSKVSKIKRSLKRIFSNLVGSHRKEAEAVLKLRNLIESGYWFSLDPGSNSAGYAYWYKDQLISSGSIKAKGGIASRLQQMTVTLTGKSAEVAVVEKVRSSTGHIYLTWSVGALLAGIGANHTLEVSSKAWQKHAGVTHIKTDENDAIAIGRYVLALCAEAA